jgi:ribulose-5-phosphate 4-epimerase/fuculose-1-phosphate aldolase
MMNRHGATVVGGGLKELVSRAIFMCQNAAYQLHALALGACKPLHRGEIERAGAISLLPNVVGRTWEYWSARVPARAPGRSRKARKPQPRSKRRK